MTTGAYIYFNNNSNKYKAIKKLSSLCIHNTNLFFIEDYKNKKKLFVKFNLTFRKNDIDFILKTKKSIKSVYNTNSQSYNLNENKNLIRKILSQCIFLKSTSKHTKTGLMYSKNFFNKKILLEELKITRYIIKL